MRLALDLVILDDGGIPTLQPAYVESYHKAGSSIRYAPGHSWSYAPGYIPAKGQREGRTMVDLCECPQCSIVAADLLTKPGVTQ